MIIKISRKQWKELMVNSKVSNLSQGNIPYGFIVYGLFDEEGNVESQIAHPGTNHGSLNWSSGFTLQNRFRYVPENGVISLYEPLPDGKEQNLLDHMKEKYGVTTRINHYGPAKQQKGILNPELAPAESGYTSGYGSKYTGLRDANKKEYMKIKLSKSQWEEIGRTAGWNPIDLGTKG